MDNPTFKWMILGYPHFRKPPHGAPVMFLVGFGNQELWRDHEPFSNGASTNVLGEDSLAGMKLVCFAKIIFYWLVVTGT